MATISKESLAQFWLSALPPADNDECTSFADATSVRRLLEFISEKKEEKKIFEIVIGHLHGCKARHVIKTIAERTSPKRRRSAKNTLSTIDTNRIRFTVNIEVTGNVDYEEETMEETPTPVEDRTIENLTSLLHESDSALLAKRIRTLIYPWLLDVSFTIANDLFSLLVELMNKSSDEFFRHCFVPWLRMASADNVHPFFANLFAQLTNLSDRCKLCSYVCQNSTCPLNANELSLLSKWFDSKEFYFSNDLLNLLPEKVAVSARIFSDSLPFAKVLHKVLLKCTENQQLISHEQRVILKQAVSSNTTILSDILLDLLD